MIGGIKILGWGLSLLTFYKMQALTWIIIVLYIYIAQTSIMNIFGCALQYCCIKFMLKVTKAWENIKNYNKKYYCNITKHPPVQSWLPTRNSQFKESWLETTANVHFIHNSNVQSK